MNTVYTELLKQLEWKSDNFLIFQKLRLSVSDRVGNFFLLYIDLLIENMSLMLVADNTSESDKIVACSLKTLMIKITLQFRKHNAMIAAEFFFWGGGGGQPWFTSLTWSNTSHLRKVQSKNLGKEVYYFKRYLFHFMKVLLSCQGYIFFSLQICRWQRLKYNKMQF